MSRRGFDSLQRAIILSKIMTADGRNIEKGFWIGTDRCESTLLWPHQAKPSKKTFKIWIKCLATTFLLDSTTSATKQRYNLELNIPLGAWHYSARKTFNRFDNFYSPSKQAILIFHRKYSLFQLHKQIQNQKGEKQ